VRSLGDRWQELLSVLAVILVAALMIIIAERSRESALHHLKAQVLVERVRASGETLSAISSQAMVDGLSSPARRRHLDNAAVRNGFAAWDDLARALTALQPLVATDEVERLQADAGEMFSIGIRTLNQARANQIDAAIRTEQLQFHPAIARLNADAKTAARRLATVASRSTSRAVAAFVASLVVGIVAIVLLGWRHQRLRRRAALAEQHRTMESRSDRRIRALLEHANDVLTVIGPDLRVRWQASSLRRMLGHDPSAIIGRPITEIIAADEADRVQAFLTLAAKRAGSHRIGTRARHAAGGSRELEIVADNRLDDPAVAGIVLSMRDVTEQKALEAELRHQAFHDPLTGFANCLLFEDRLQHAIARAARSDRSCAVLFLDLDDFKLVNDRYGHARGDALLRDLALRLGRIVRPSDTAARLGGDEFAILMDGLERPDDAQSIAQRVSDALGYPFVIDGEEVSISASIGIAVGDGLENGPELLKHADMAMYAAKQQGKDSIQNYLPDQIRSSRLSIAGEV
jgi:diguanylate cyclase (GGDEF)-like protein/PAS domain S-box-containing protein